MDISKITDTELAQALKICSDEKLLCITCPAMRYECEGQDCYNDIRVLAAGRIAKLAGEVVSIQAARDALEKQLKKMGVCL